MKEKPYNYFLQYVVPESCLSALSLQTLKELRDRKSFEDYIVNQLQQAGFYKNDAESNDIGDCWVKSFNAGYYVTKCYVIVGYNKKHNANWQYGVQWIEMEYEYQERALSSNDLEDMQNCLDLCVDCLLANGIPFRNSRKNEYLKVPSQKLRNYQLQEITRLFEEEYKFILEDCYKGNEMEMWKRYQQRNKTIIQRNYSEYYIDVYNYMYYELEFEKKYGDIK